MVWRRAAHSAYDTAYHLVWSPKYRKGLLTGALAKRVGERFREGGEAHDITIEEMEVSVRSCAHFLFVSAALCDIADRGEAQEFKCASDIQGIPVGQAKAVGRRVAEGRYFVRTVGDKVTAEVIRQYIRRHKEESDPQLKLF